MNLIQYLETQLAAARRLVDQAIEELTDEQFNWNPGGTANSIAVNLLHINTAEDYYVSAVIRGKPKVFDSQNWGAKLGLSATPRPGRWEEVRNTKLSLGTVLAYQAAVREASVGVFDNLTPDDLDQLREFPGGARPLGAILAQFASHTAFHAGEISTIKGIQGAKGLPY